MYNTFCATSACGPTIKSDDIIRLARCMVRPVIGGLIVAVLAVSLAMAIRDVTPYVTNAGVMSHHLATSQGERKVRERELQTQVNAYLASLNGAAPNAPTSMAP